MKHRGLIHLYCGDGKGKTTAAFGLAMRAAAHGRRVLILQLMKDGSSGEAKLAAKLPGVCVVNQVFTRKFTVQMTPEECSDTRKRHNAALAWVQAHMAQYDLLILDEFVSAWTTGLLDRDFALQMLQGRPEHLEVVLTGRNPPQELMDIADYISDIACVRHPYTRGVPAREGVEF